MAEQICDTRELGSHLGEIEFVPLRVARYATCHTSIIATGERDRAPGELFAAVSPD